MNVFEWRVRWGVNDTAMQELYAILQPSMPTGVHGSTSEAALQAELRVNAAVIGASLWRNNSGALQDAGDRWVRFGLGNDSKKLNAKWKSSDLIGITPVTSTAIGQVFGVFTAVECKHPEWKVPMNDRERAQQNFLRTVKGLGGLAGFARAADDYKGILSYE